MRTRTSFVILLILVLGALLFSAAYNQLPAAAQGGGGSVAPTKTVSDDAVNQVARRLFCPVCENIPLDACGTAACAQWRDEIRLQLQSGKTDQQIVDDFVKRYGDRVVGTPQDPALRTLTFVAPLIISVIALGAAAYVFLRWRAEQVALSRRPAGSAAAASPNLPEASAASENDYRARLERDLARRR